MRRDGSQDKRGRALRTFRVMALVLAIGLVPLSIGGAVFQHESSERSRAELDRSLAGEASASAVGLENYFARARAVILLTAQNPVFRQFYRSPGPRRATLKQGGEFRNGLNDALAYLERLYPTSIGEACFIDRGGPEIARVVRGVRARPEELSPDESGNPFFKPTFALEHGQVYQARPYVSPDTGEWVVANSTLIPTPDGSKRAIVHFEVTLESFRRTLAKSRFHLYIVDAGTGAVIVDNRRPQQIGGKLGSPGNRGFAALVGRAGARGVLDLAGARAAYQRLKPRPGNANSWMVVATAEPVAASVGSSLPPIALLGIALLVIAFAAARRWVRVHTSLDDHREDLELRNRDLAKQAEELERSLREGKEAEEALSRSEEQLRQAQKMEAVGRLAGGVAHDFNNQMSAVVGFGELVLRRLAQGDPMRGHVEQMVRAGERASGMTNQLLAFSRKQVLQPRVLDLNTVVLDAEALLRRLIGEDIALATVLDPELCLVEADPVQLEQVIVNLAVNARDAMPTGGKLTIETTNVDIDESYAAAHFDVEPGPYALLALTDTGVGMDAETQARIFEPFFTTKGEGQGTGLGLATVFGIVKQSGGDLSVYSEPGHGTTFKIYLPHAQRHTEQREVREPQRTLPRGAETILLVEDEEAVRNLEQEVLAECGYTVLVAPTPRQALEIAASHEGSIDLLLTDVVMPELSGRELAERLAPTRPEMKVLYSSGYADDAVIRHGVLEEEVAFLAKPLTPAALAAKVREVIDTLGTERARDVGTARARAGTRVHAKRRGTA